MELDEQDEAVGIDLGGTKVAGMRVSRSGEIQARSDVLDSPAQDVEGLIAAIMLAARQVLSDRVRAVGVGSAGIVEFQKGIVRYAPNVAWRDTPVRERVSSQLGLPCLLDNDANAAAWGEFRFGAGRGMSEMLLVTVGTGIGGGIVSGGRMFRGAHGFAAEIGHVIVEPGGPLCGCGNLGCWEQVAAGRAIDRLGRAAAAEHQDSLIVELAGGDPQAVRGPMVTEAAMRGDEVAVKVLAEVGRRLGEGIAGLVNILDPEIVVVGGGAIVAGDLLLEPARAAFVDAVEAPEHRELPAIVAAELGNDAGAVGAAALALEELATALPVEGERPARPAS
jgi:glucokinase